MPNRNELFWINEDSRVVFALKSAGGISETAIVKKSKIGGRIFGSEGLGEALELLGCPANRLTGMAYIENSSQYSFGIVNTPYCRSRRIVNAMAENQFLGANRIDGKDCIISSRPVKSDGKVSSHIVCTLETMDVDHAYRLSGRHKIKMSGIYAGIDAGICAYLNRAFGGKESMGVLALDCGYSYSVAVMHQGRALTAFRAKKSEYARAAEQIKEVLSGCSRKSLDDFVILSHEGDYFAENVIRGSGIKTDNMTVSREVQEYILEGIFMG